MQQIAPAGPGDRPDSITVPSAPHGVAPLGSSAPAVVEKPAGAAPSLRDLADAAGSDRNRAVDCYRAVAMTAVAVGHWAAVDVWRDADGGLMAGNALDRAPSLAWASWLFQVMPLFFVVGGFSSAMSLDSHNAKGGRPQDWVASRLRRMLAPTIVLAATWLGLIALGATFGGAALIGAGAVAAAIPLWFLANYTIDTALAPYVLPRFRRNPGLVAGGLLSAFAAFEVLRFLDVPVLPQINWVIGWLLFQVAGFAWRDGLLPSGRRMAGLAAGFWATAVAAVTIGPYPVSMVHFPEIGDLSPTHPPSIALLLFGAAYSSTALAVAPRVSAWLARPGARRAWAAVVAANGVAMSVYLWHFTAAVAAAGLLHTIGGPLPSSAVGSAAWWMEKLPLMGLSAMLLGLIVSVVARFEQRALFAPRTAWPGGPVSMMVVAAVVSTGLKTWTAGSTTTVVIGAATVLLVWPLLGSGLLSRSGAEA